MLTNELNLPQPIVEAIRNDPYEKGDCQFSATELIAPAYQRNLMRLHGNEVDVDASESIWSLLGQSVHGILERAEVPGCILERRYIGVFYVDGEPIRVGAKIDVYDFEKGILSDYKVTSVYKFKRDLNGRLDVPEEYEAQLNIQVECIFRETGYEVPQAQIVGILRDWRRSERRRSPAEYPKFQVAVMPVRVWPHEERERYILERLKEHMSASPVPCTSNEMWERPDVSALMKDGQKRAVRLYKADEDARSALAKMGGKVAGYYVDVRPGCRMRCEDYCEVSSKCPIYQGYLSAKESST